MELLGDALRPLLQAGVVEGEEETLLEGELGYQGTQVLVTSGELLTLEGCQPFNIGVTLLPPVLSAKDREESLRLGLSEFHEVSPSAEFVPYIKILGSAEKIADLCHSMLL